MKRIILIQRIFIFILIAFCITAFTYSPLSSNTKWLNELTHQTIQRANNQLQNHAALIQYEVQRELNSRPDDQAILRPIDTILQNIEHSQIKVKRLLEHNQITEVNQLFDSLNQYNEGLLQRLSKITPIITEEEVDQVLLESIILPISKNSDLDTIINNLYYNNWGIARYLYSKAVGTVIWCGFPEYPKLNIPRFIPQGETVQGKIHLPKYANHLTQKQFYINHQRHFTKYDGLVKLDTTFLTKGKHSIEVQVDYKTTRMVNFDLEETLESVRDTFEIYVFD